MTSQRSRARTAKTTSGCLICRLRRKKCDERKPTCVGCERNKLICTWPSPSNGPGGAKKAWRKHLASSSTSLNSIVPAISDGNPRSKESIIETSTVPSSCSATLRFHSSIPQAPKRLYEGPNAQLFEHYIHSTASQIAGRIIPENPFLSHIIPIAFFDDRVLESMLAISGAHLFYRYPHLELDARSHYAVALRGIKHGLQSYASSTPSKLVGLLAGTLLLCLFEVRPDSVTRSLIAIITVSSNTMGNPRL